MGYVEDLKATLADAFSTFPLLLVGFVFLFGTFTSNTGLLYLLLGQLLIVPSIGFLSNLHKRPWRKEDGSKDIGGAIKTLFAGFITYFTNAHSSESWWTTILLSIGFISQFVLNSKYPLSSSSIPSCGMIPTESDEPGSVYTTPSMWVLHLCFFVFFLISNAISIYNLPAPEITRFQDEKTLKSRQERLEARVTTRKSTAIMTICISIVMLLGLLYIRYNKTECEKGFWLSFPAIAIISMTGYNYFSALVTYCGIRPADVFGIVSGMINPDLADNPIVCVGE